MIYWLPAEPWRPLIAWYKDVRQKDFHQFHYRTGRSERQKGIPRRYHGGYTAYFIVSHNMSVKTGPIIVHNKKRSMEMRWTMKLKDIYLQAVRYIMLQLEDI